PGLGEARLQQRLDLGRERDSVAGLDDIERLDPEAVTGEHKPPTGSVPHRLRPHAVEALEATGAPLAVGGERYLGVARAGEAVAARRELVAELHVVVDLAVVHDPVAAVRRTQRLVAAGREVENREAARTEHDAGAVWRRLAAGQEREGARAAARRRVLARKRH